VPKEKNMRLKAMKKEVRAGLLRLRRRLFIFDRVMALIAVALIGLLRPDYVLMAAYLIIFPCSLQGSLSFIISLLQHALQYYGCS